MPEPTPEPGPTATQAVASAEVRHVIIRACIACGGKREADAPCEQCGNRTPPEVHDLGVVSAVYRNPVRRAVWWLFRKPLAERRIRRANRRAMQLRAQRE